MHLARSPTPFKPEKAGYEYTPVDAPAGSGKTYNIRAIVTNLRAHRKLVLFAASTGIAYPLLPGGLIASSTFDLPFGNNLVEGSICNIQVESDRAEVLRKAGLNMWNELLMSRRLDLKLSISPSNTCARGTNPSAEELFSSRVTGGKSVPVSPLVQLMTSSTQP